MPSHALLLATVVVLAALLIVDMHQQRLPDPLNFLLGLLGLGFHYLRNFDLIPLIALLAGASLSALLLYGLHWLYLCRRAVEALGLGDVKFVAAAGLWVGIENIFLVIFAGALLTLLLVATRALLRREGIDWRSQTRIPFGPGLIVAAAAVFLANVYHPW